MRIIVPILLFVVITLPACAGAPVSIVEPEPLGTPTSPSIAVCDLPVNWTIHFNRSGGIAGWDESMTVDSGGRLTVQSERPPADEQRAISEDQIKEIADLLAAACPFEVQESDMQCADCFAYGFVIQMNGSTYQVEATDVTLTEELHPIVNVLGGLLLDTGK